MTNPPKKIAIVGLGAAARRIHLPAYQRVDGLEVTGGCDLASSTKPLPGSMDVPMFGSVEEMLERTRPDILTVATPPATHFELARQGLDAGCHVLCEKPFTTTMEEARRLVELASDRRRHVVVNNQYRFMNIHREARDRIGGLDFGDLLFLNAEQTFRRDEATESGWRGQGEERTCREFGTHVLDLCRFFFGEDPIEIHARMPRGSDPTSPDFLNLIDLTFSGDRAAHITLDRLCRGRHRYLEMRLDGSNGCIETRLGGGVEFHTGIRGGQRRPYLAVDVSMGGRARIYQGEKFRKIASDPLDVFANATRRLVEAFLSALERGETPPCDGTDNIRSLALVFAAYESHRKGHAIRMNYES